TDSSAEQHVNLDRAHIVDFARAPIPPGSFQDPDSRRKLEMTQVSLRTPPATTLSTVKLANEGSEPTPTPLSSRRVRRVPRITVEFGCLMCSREFGTLVCTAIPVCGVVTIQQPGGFHTAVSIEQLRFLRCATC